MNMSRPQAVCMKKVFVNGTFDILHCAHIELLNYAKSLGDYLIVAIDSDSRVKQLKGNDRPINNQHERKIMMEVLKPVDQVHIFYSHDDLVDLIKTLDVDIIVKGSDHKGNPVEGEQYVNEVVWFERIDDYSSTNKIESIISSGQLR